MIPSEGCRQADIAIERCELILFVTTETNEKAKL